MKTVVGVAAVAVVLWAAVPCRAAAAEVGQLIQKAETMAAAGDRAGAVQVYTDAINAMRLSGQPESACVRYLVERDRLAAALLGEVADIHKKQIEILELQKGIAQKMTKVAQTDKDVQERTKKSEDKLKDIESILLDAEK